MLTEVINIPFHMLSIKITVCWDAEYTGTNIESEHVIGIEAGGSTYVHNLGIYKVRSMENWNFFFTEYLLLTLK
jgi:hypothetical protein